MGAMSGTSVVGGFVGAVVGAAVFFTVADAVGNGVTSMSFTVVGEDEAAEVGGCEGDFDEATGVIVVGVDDGGRVGKAVFGQGPHCMPTLRVGNKTQDSVHVALPSVLNLCNRTETRPQRWTGSGHCRIIEPPRSKLAADEKERKENSKNTRATMVCRLAALIDDVFVLAAENVGRLMGLCRVAKGQDQTSYCPRRLNLNMTQWTMQSSLKFKIRLTLWWRDHLRKCLNDTKQAVIELFKQPQVSFVEAGRMPSVVPVLVDEL
jgi:hypothetical protein